MSTNDVKDMVQLLEALESRPPTSKKPTGKPRSTPEQIDLALVRARVAKASAAAAEHLEIAVPLPPPVPLAEDEDALTPKERRRALVVARSKLLAEARARSKEIKAARLEEKTKKFNEGKNLEDRKDYERMRLQTHQALDELIRRRKSG
jgi:hypothetical protein